MTGILWHFGNPCVHCGRGHDDVDLGPCEGDPSKAVPTAYASLGVCSDGVEHFRIRFSNGRVEDRWQHISQRAPYFHFGRYRVLTQPPPYDAALSAAKGDAS